MPARPKSGGGGGGKEWKREREEKRRFIPWCQEQSKKGGEGREAGNSLLPLSLSLPCMLARDLLRGKKRKEEEEEGATAVGRSVDSGWGRKRIQQLLSLFFLQKYFSMTVSQDWLEFVLLVICFEFGELLVSLASSRLPPPPEAAAVGSEGENPVWEGGRGRLVPVLCVICGGGGEEMEFWLVGFFFPSAAFGLGNDATAGKALFLLGQRAALKKKCGERKKRNAAGTGSDFLCCDFFYRRGMCKMWFRFGVSEENHQNILYMYA